MTIYRHAKRCDYRWRPIRTAFERNHHRTKAETAWLQYTYCRESKSCMNTYAMQDKSSFEWWIFTFGCLSNPIITLCISQIVLCCKVVKSEWHFAPRYLIRRTLWLVDYLWLLPIRPILKISLSQGYSAVKNLMWNAFFSSFFLFYFFIVQFLCERSIKLLVLLYKIVVHKNEMQKCKYLGHVSFIYHVWCFSYSKLKMIWTLFVSAIFF